MLYGLSGLVLSLATSGQNKMRHRNRLTFLLVLLVTACSQTVRPTAPPAPTAVVSSQTLTEEDKHVALGHRELLTFSLPRKQLAHFVIEVARQHGWKAKDTVKEWTAFVVVHIERPSGSLFISDKKSIYIWKPKADVDAPPGGSFIVLSREVIGKFPVELIEPLKERVRVHLAGRPLTTEEKKEAATQVPKPPG